MDIAAARKVCEAVTREPWTLFFDEGLGYGIISPAWEVKYIPHADAEFIRAARTGWPAALDALEEARGTIAEDRRVWQQSEEAWEAGRDKWSADASILRGERGEAEGKLNAVRAWRQALKEQLRDGGGAIIDWNTLDRILKEEK